MRYQTRNYNHLLGMEGFSDVMLGNHFSLYEGYVKNANGMMQTLDDLLNQNKTGIEFSEIKRRLGFELNGIKLHEYYFENLQGRGAQDLDRSSKFFKKIALQFGNFEKWKKSFEAVAVMRGIGWEALVYDPEQEYFFNIWIEEHHIGNVAGMVPILVLDLWEHAMMLDYGTNRKAYLEAFFNAVDWTAVANRYHEASSHEEVARHAWRKAS
ncbi:MAG: superoxide dismutase [Candidatus Omnitrophica bacterium]|nr:superoxide dismutase [Candidatus Omnitrophota bacterium]